MSKYIKPSKYLDVPFRQELMELAEIVDMHPAVIFTNALKIMELYRQKEQRE